MNELSTEIKFEVDFKPSEITIVNEDKLKEIVEGTVAHYDSLLFTEENVDEAKKSKAELNSMFKLLDDQRKKVKKEYNKPLNEFESKIKGYSEQITKVSEKINIGISDYEEKEKNKRIEKVSELINAIAPKYEVDIAEIEVRDSWFNKGSFTTKGEVNKKTLEEITGVMTLVANENKRIESEKEVVSKYAAAVGMENAGWELWIDKNTTSSDVMKKIDQAVEDNKRKVAEEEKKAEYEKAMKELNEQQIGETTVNVETGEVIEEETTVVPIKKAEETHNNIQSVTLKLTGTYEQLIKVNNYIISLGIDVKEV